MSAAPKGKVEAVSIRLYLQEGDRYLAIASVDRQVAPNADGSAPAERPLVERYTGASESSVGAALASVLQVSGVLEG